MAVKTLSKHEVRTQETRRLLLEAAEQIFARDGYEGAELGEIATLAGRTKGAIYAQFKSKEDIFLALVEDRRDYYRRQMEELLAESSGIEGNLESMRRFFLKHIENSKWALLLLEFKLFSNRHSKVKKRFQAIFSENFSPNAEKRYSDIIGPAGKGKNAVSRVLAIQMLMPLLAAVVLEANVSYPPLDEDAVKKVAGLVFDALLQGQPDKPKSDTEVPRSAIGRNGVSAKKKPGTTVRNGSAVAV